MLHVTVFETLLFGYRLVLSPAQRGTGSKGVNTCTIKLQAGNLIDKITNHMPNFLIIQNMGEEPKKISDKRHD